MGILLASASPRRKELMERAGYPFTVEVSQAEEILPPEITEMKDACRYLAELKAKAVAKKHPGDYVIGSDTIVELDGKGLGKPKSEAEAVKMLTALSGRTHFVRTGVAVIHGDIIKSTTATASVTFKALTEKEIADYVATGEPMDKAGAYGIQGKGRALIATYSGDFDTIMGLSMKAVKELLTDMGYRH